jgi:hypothetical protein
MSEVNLDKYIVGQIDGKDVIYADEFARILGNSVYMHKNQYESGMVLIHQNRLLRDLVYDLAEQQAYKDDWWKEELDRIGALTYEDVEGYLYKELSLGAKIDIDR